MAVICYEQPLNEKTRILLRLENLFEKIDFFSAGNSPYEHHAALGILFEILDVTSRSDLKSDLLQELDKQRTKLENLRNNPSVSEAALDQILDELQTAFRGLLDISGRIGSHLRDNEWLMSIRQRMNIPGGACEFDLPAYHHWLSVSAESRQKDLADWIAPFSSVRNGVGIILNMLRNSGKSVQHTATAGVFQQPGSEYHAHLLRLCIEDEHPCIPEISASKYALNVRFTLLQTNDKSSVLEEDIPFELTFCSF